VSILFDLLFCPHYGGALQFIKSPAHLSSNYGVDCHVLLNILLKLAKAAMRAKIWRNYVIDITGRLVASRDVWDYADRLHY
jgi:hypothetical protein